MTNSIDEDDGDEDARDEKLTSFSSGRRCHQRTSPPSNKYDLKQTKNTNIQPAQIYKYKTNAFLLNTKDFFKTLSLIYQCRSGRVHVGENFLTLRNGTCGNGVLMVITYFFRKKI